VKLPPRIRLKKGVTYEILRQDEIASDPDCMGLCNADNRTIIIKTSLSDTQALETLIHELLHAIAFEFQIKIPHSLIYAIERPIIRILKLNKWI
jgi:hypothetical protein